MKKRHHHIPCFYLNSFTNKDKIWTYDIDGDSVRSSSVENTAFENHLYSFTKENGARSAELEDLIATIEGEAAPLLKNYLEGAELKGKRKEDLATLFALMYARTDSYRKLYAQLMMHGLQTQNYIIASHDELFESTIKRYEQTAGPITEEVKLSIKDGMKNPEKFIFSVSKEWTLKAFNIIDVITPIIKDMEWTLLSAPEERFFITSDNPLLKWISPDKQHPLYGVGFLTKDVEISMPLSPTKCWLGHWNKDLKIKSTISVEQVKFLNRLRSLYADKYLYADRNCEGVRALAKKYKDIKPGIKISGPGPEKYSKINLHRGK